MKQIDYSKIEESKKFCNTELYDLVAEEFNIPVEQVKGIIESQFTFTFSVIKGGSLKSVLLPYLGKFKVNHKRVQRIMANGYHSNKNLKKKDGKAI